MPNSENGQTLHDIAKDIVTKEKEPPIHIGNLLKEHGLAVFHVRPYQMTKQQKEIEAVLGNNSDRPMTIVYRVPQRSDRVLEIATAVLHPLDDYTKKVGAKIAIDNFLAGKTVLVPRNPKQNPAHIFRHMFGGFYY